MSDVAEKMARRRQLRNAAMVAVVIPAALLAACAPAAGSAAAAAAADTDGRSAAATASGSGCPRLIDGAVRRKDPILERSIR